MRNDKNAVSFFAKYKKTLIRSGIVVIAVVIIISALILKGYTEAKEKYEGEIETLKSEIAELKKEPIVWDDKPTTEISVDLLKSEIKDIGELVTLEYLYTDAGKFEDPKQLFGVDIPFTTKSFLAKWDGKIKAGVEIEKVEIEVYKNSKEILVRVPKAEILSHTIVEESFETLDEKNGLFNPIKVDDVKNFDTKTKKQMEERAIDNGILEKAYENAKAIIARLVNNEVVQEQGYTVKFEQIK